MRRFALVLPLLGATFLAGCAGTPGTVPPAVTPVVTDITTLIPQVQQAAQKACGWVPLAADVGTLIGVLFPASGPITTVVTSTAQAICSQVNAASGTQSARLRGLPPAAVMVDGVRVRHNTATGAALAPYPATIIVNGVVIHRQ